MTNFILKLEDSIRMYAIWKLDVAVVKGKSARGRSDRLRFHIIGWQVELLENSMAIALGTDMYFYKHGTFLYQSEACNNVEHQLAHYE